MGNRNNSIYHSARAEDLVETIPQLEIWDSHGTEIISSMIKIIAVALSNKNESMQRWPGRAARRGNCWELIYQ